MGTPAGLGNPRAAGAGRIARSGTSAPADRVANGDREPEAGSPMDRRAGSLTEAYRLVWSITAGFRSASLVGLLAGLAASSATVAGPLLMAAFFRAMAGCPSSEGDARPCLTTHRVDLGSLLEATWPRVQVTPV